MSDQNNPGNPIDEVFVSRQPHERRHVREKHGITDQVLQDIIDKVGNLRVDVEKEIKRRKGQ